MVALGKDEKFRFIIFDLDSRCSRFCINLNWHYQIVLFYVMATLEAGQFALNGFQSLLIVTRFLVAKQPIS